MVIQRLFSWLLWLQKESVELLRPVMSGSACMQQIFHITFGERPFYLFIPRYHKTGLVG